MMIKPMSIPDSQFKQEDELIYKLVTKPLLSKLKWKKDNKGREYIYQKATRLGGYKVKWFKSRKDYHNHQNNNDDGGLGRNFADISESKDTYHIRLLTNLVKSSLPEEFKALYKENKITTKRKEVVRKAKLAIEKATLRNQQKAIENKKLGSLDFKVVARKEIARTILLSILNKKLEGTGFKFDKYIIYSFNGSVRLSNYFSVNSFHLSTLVETAYGSNNNKKKKLDLTGNDLFEALSCLVDDPQQILSELLIGGSSHCRRFATVYGETKVVGLLDDDITVRFAAERLIRN